MLYSMKSGMAGAMKYQKPVKRLPKFLKERGKSLDQQQAQGDMDINAINDLAVEEGFLTAEEAAEPLDGWDKFEVQHELDEITGGESSNVMSSW